MKGKPNTYYKYLREKKKIEEMFEAIMTVNLSQLMTDLKRQIQETQDYQVG